MSTIKRAARWVTRRSASLLLIVTAAGLAAGGRPAWQGPAGAADAAWLSLGDSPDTVGTGRPAHVLNAGDCVRV